jgi:hypothetical protein
VQATWKTTLDGTVTPGGELTIGAGNKGQVGAVQAAFESLNASADVLVYSMLPIEANFDAMQPGRPPANWVNAGVKYEVRAVDGNNVLVKLADNPATTRARTFIGPNDYQNYTVEADVRAIDRRRQMGDPGLVAGRYQLTLYGNVQMLRIEPWQPETVQPWDANLTRTLQVPFAWKGNVWYRMKLRVENLDGGRTRVQGKVWPKGEPEPAAWTIEKIDPLGSRQGAPGIYANAQNEIFIDNIQVTSN